MKRKASATWNGSLEKGQGHLSTASGVLNDTPYSFATRFKDEKGTNPEELIGAAHAGCFSMALSGMLTKEGFEPRSIDTAATVTLDKVNDQWTVVSSKLTCDAEVPDIDVAKFKEIAENAKKNCPISRLLNAEITLEARLNDWKEVDRTL